MFGVATTKKRFFWSFILERSFLRAHEAIAEEISVSKGLILSIWIVLLSYMVNRGLELLVVIRGWSILTILQRARTDCFLLEPLNTFSTIFNTFVDMLDESWIKLMLLNELLSNPKVIVSLMKEDAVGTLRIYFDFNNG